MFAIGLAFILATIVVALTMVSGADPTTQTAGNRSESEPGGAKGSAPNAAGNPGGNIGAGVHGCGKRETVEADVDGDGAIDFVFHDWIGNGPVLGVCSAEGQADRISGVGQSELLEIIDLQSDGRDEIFFGGTSVSAQFFSVATFGEDHQLRRVRLKSREPLLVVNGLELDPLKKVDLVGKAIGCEDVDNDGVMDLTQVMVRPQHKKFRWKKATYNVDQATAVVISRDSGKVKNDPERRDKAEVVDIARGLTSRCAFKR